MSDHEMSIQSIDSVTSNAESVRYEERHDFDHSEEPVVDLYNGKEMILSPFQDAVATCPRFSLVWAVEHQENLSLQYCTL